MTQAIQAEPTHCDRCKSALDGRYSNHYKEVNGEFVKMETTCEECEIESQFGEFVKTDYISLSLLTKATLGVYKPNLTKLGKRQRTTRRDFKTEKDRLFEERLQTLLLRLELASHKFEGKVWFDTGLGNFVRKQTMRGLSGKYRDWYGAQNDPTYTGFEMDVRTYSMAGRCVITFETTKRDDNYRYDGQQKPEPGTQITFITDESSKRHCMGWKSVNGKAEDVLTLADIATWGWGEGNRLLPDEKVDWESKLQRDDNVSIL